MGLENLIKAIKLIQSDYPNKYTLKIAGIGRIETELRDLVKHLQLEDSIEFLGLISRNDLIKNYQIADLVVMPSQILEGFGLTTVEALSCGTPVMGTPNGGTKEILEKFDSNLLFSGESALEIKSGILSNIDRLLTSEYRESCRAYATSSFDWDIITRSYSKTYSAVLENK